MAKALGPDATGRVVVAIDAGTTGVRSLAVDEHGRVVASFYREFPQYFPRPGWVEHEPDEIWAAVAGTLSDLLAAIGRPPAAIGITDQRETVVVWDGRTGQPLHRAIVWQDRRTAAVTEALAAAGHLETVRRATGLVLDPYFSATKLAWVLGPGGVVAGPNTAFGTVDSWLVWKLSGGTAHVTDTTNASRTLLFDIDRLEWHPALAELFGVPMSVLPEVGPSSGRLATTATDVIPGLPAGTPISGVAGDQQAALFGQACFRPGMTKNTYGTGSFVLMNVGPERPSPVDGLLTTVAWSLGDVSPSRTDYALEGAVFVTGAAVQWLRDGLGLIAESAEVGPLAARVADTSGAYFVPALTGLGSPWWDPYARGTLVGLTRGVGRPELARAAVEAMAYQTVDVVASMTEASGHDLAELRVDGGASVMDLLLQFQADLLGVPVRRSATADTTALGAAYLAGLAEGVWASPEEIASLWQPAATAEPAADRTGALTAYEGWKRAVERALGWDPEPA
jgi:glycerol kinase